MTPKVREFLGHVKAYLASGNKKPFEKFLYSLKPRELQECLLAFVEASPSFPVNKQAMEVFWSYSFFAVGRGSSYYALEYEYRVRPEANTEWSKRFAWLRQDQQDVLRKEIERKKDAATQYERERFWVFRRNAEDAAAAAAAERKASKAPGKRVMSATVKAFVKLFHKYMAGSIPQTVLSEALMPDKRVLTREELEGCFHAYVAEARQYSLTDLSSLYVFEKVSSIAVRRCGGYFALKFEWWCITSTEKTVLSQLYANLPDKGPVTQDLAIAKQRLRVLDPLKFAYFKAKGHDPDVAKLRSFEPPYDRELYTELSDRVHSCLVDARRQAVRTSSFGASWDRLVARYDQASIPELLLMLKWCREHRTTDDDMRDHLYWVGIGVLFGKLLRDKDKVVLYARGFDDEEKRFFIDTNRKLHPYVGDFELRLAYLMQKRDETAFRQLSKAQALLELYARIRGLELATIADTALIYARSDQLLDSLERAAREKRPLPKVPKMAVKQSGNLANPNATITIGESFEGLTVVWLEGVRGYLEPRRFPRVLLIAVESDFSHQLGELTKHNRFHEQVAENTAALAKVIPVFWQFLSYVPDLVSGGLTGLAKSVLFDRAADALATRIAGSGPEADVLAAALNVAAGHLTEPRAKGLPGGDGGAAGDVFEEAINVPADVQRRLAHAAKADDLPPSPPMMRPLGKDMIARGLDDPGVPAASGRPGGETHIDEPARPGTTPVDEPDRPATPALGETDRPAAAVREPDPPASPAAAVPDPAPGASTSFKDARKKLIEERARLMRPPEKPPEKPPKKPPKKRRPAAKKPPIPEPIAPRPKPATKKPTPKKKRTTRSTASTASTRPKQTKKQTSPVDSRSRATGTRGTGDRGRRNGRAKVDLTGPGSKVVTTEPFQSGYVKYRFKGRVDAFRELQSLIPTRFQVYDIRDAQGRTIYVGIAGGDTKPRDALDRLLEHLYTKDGEFIGDAATIVIRGVDLDERLARALEDDLISANKVHKGGPKYNNRDRDRFNYRRKYGTDPPPEDVKLANNRFFVFTVDFLEKSRKK